MQSIVIHTTYYTSHCTVLCHTVPDTPQLDETKQLVSLTELGCQRVLGSLLVELLYLRGQTQRDTVEDLPRLFHLLFGFSLPLALLSADSVSQLLEVPEIQTRIQVYIHTHTQTLSLPFGIYYVLPNIEPCTLFTCTIERNLLSHTKVMLCVCM